MSVFGRLRATGDSRTIGVAIGRLSHGELVERFVRLNDAVAGTVRHATGAGLAGGTLVVAVGASVAEQGGANVAGAATGLQEGAPVGALLDAVGQFLSDLPLEGRAVMACLLATTVACGAKAVRGWRSEAALREAAGELWRRLPARPSSEPSGSASRPVRGPVMTGQKTS